MIPRWGPALAAMLAVWAGLLLWYGVAGRVDCLVSALFLVLAAVAVALSATEAAFYRRHAFVSQYLHPEGVLSRLLQRRTLLALWQGAKAVLLGLVLLVSSLTFEPLQWLVLLLDALLMAWLTAGLSRLLGGEVRAVYREAVARQWALRVNAAALWAVSVAILFFSAQENYRGLEWQAIVALGASRAGTGCDALAVLSRLHAVAEALAMWGGQNLLGGLQRPVQVLMAWLAFLGAFGASFLVAWAYSRALAGTLSRPWRIPGRGADRG